MGDWTKFIRTDGQSSDARAYVTLRRAAIAFNAHFVRANKLTDMTRVTIYCDPSQYRVGFRFHSDSADQNSFALTGDGGHRGGDSRAVQVNSLMKRHRWLSAAARSSAASRTHYQPEWRAADGLWVINVRPSFETHAASANDIEPGICGIYRYIADGRVVYIGRGDIRARTSSPERAQWVIDAIEFSEVEDSDEQAKWEASWLDEHRNESGTLPLYNRIGGKRDTATDRPSQQPLPADNTTLPR
jgi:hypothetical protein